MVNRTENRTDEVLVVIVESIEMQLWHQTIKLKPLWHSALESGLGGGGVCPFRCINLQFMCHFGPAGRRGEGSRIQLLHSTALTICRHIDQSCILFCI